ncbi:quinone oxidoreductase family protein [Paenibacillus guangzhouensis]|uniref:quinone oxidoreductase family protein n=1 Tax=Paenibacillus guangzhouensis TaxID=1473112 RepID=UPI00187B9AD6|nr:quinone oxidoreductase [Paenibacillus guangzhouensis]
MNMQAIRIHAYGGPEVMQLEELPIPTPAPGEALIRVQAASVNFLDLQHRRGDLVQQAFYKKKGGLNDNLPATIGSQCVGIVEALGSDDTRVKIGDRVICGGGGGTYATHVLAPANHLIPVPEELTLEQATAGLVQGFMAYALTHEAYPIKPGDWCLVHAAAGGVGLFLVQMAKIRGGRVIAVVSTEEKAQAVREAGADEVIISTQADFAKEARRIAEGRGVNVVYDGVGKDTFEGSLDSLAPRGYLELFGQASGFVPPLDLMTLQEKGSLYINRFSLLYFRDAWHDYAEHFVRWVQQGQVSVKIDRIYPLADAAQAHKTFEQRKISGRILLIP